MEKKRISSESSSFTEPPPKRQATAAEEIEQKQGSNLASYPEAAATESPYRKMVNHLQAVLQQQNAKEYMLIRGCKSDADDEEEGDENESEEEDKKNDKLTEEQIKSIRFIVLPNRREQYLQKMLRKVLGNQYGDSVLMFNTSFSYHIFDLILKQLNAVGRHKPVGEKFDLLFALSYAVSRYDYWVNDNEDPSEVKRLAELIMKKWKTLLIKRNEELEIDGDFTRPGVIAMLENFSETLKDSGINVPVPSF